GAVVMSACPIRFWSCSMRASGRAMNSVPYVWRSTCLRRRRRKHVLHHSFAMATLRFFDRPGGATHRADRDVGGPRGDRRLLAAARPAAHPAGPARSRQRDHDADLPQARRPNSLRRRRSRRRAHRSGATRGAGGGTRGMTGGVTEVPLGVEVTLPDAAGRPRQVIHVYEPPTRFARQLARAHASLTGPGGGIKTLGTSVAYARSIRRLLAFLGDRGGAHPAFGLSADV